MEFFTIIMFIVYILLSNRMDEQDAKSEDLQRFLDKIDDKYK